MILLQPFLQKRHGFVQIGYVPAVFVVQHEHGGSRLGGIAARQRLDTPHVASQPFEFCVVPAHMFSCRFDGCTRAQWTLIESGAPA